MKTQSMFERQLSQDLVRPEPMVMLDNGKYRLHVPDVFIGDYGVRIVTSASTDVVMSKEVYEDACAQLALRSNVSMELEHPSINPLIEATLPRFITVDLTRVIGFVSAVVTKFSVDSECLFVDVEPIKSVPLSYIWNAEPPIPFKVGLRGLLIDGKFSIITFDIVTCDDSSPHQILSITKG